ncbi:hypothetical protein HMPREF1550_00264 [Actinomyces sp. oral taxon 877 str. F0543]|nr:hypothetical protein HMPREF1550_00264 [Actinomyces sp. oral taxon 877 str. F0543]
MPANLSAARSPGQGAPSTIRCIKTLARELVCGPQSGSGSTQHHQVH